MKVERLGPRHPVGAFDCGNTQLTQWLHLHALENQSRNISRTFVLVDDAERVVGFYSLAMGGVRKDNLPRALARGLPDYEIGMVLLARLAIDRDSQGRGFGRDLMVDALRQAARAGEYVAARFIAVDPIDEEARTFYSRFGFQDIEGDPRRRMYLRIDVAMAALNIDSA